MKTICVSFESFGILEIAAKNIENWEIKTSYFIAYCFILCTRTSARKIRSVSDNQYIFHYTW